MGILRQIFTGTAEPVLAVADQETPEFSELPGVIGEQEIPAQIFGLTSYTGHVAPAPRVARREAIQVAAVKRSRDLIAGSLGQLPLVVVKPDLNSDRTTWLNQPEGDVARSVTMTRTVEDLLFEGIAWWRVVAFDWRGFPARVERLEPHTVTVMPDGRVRRTLAGHHGVAEQWPQDAELIRFDSPNDPLLVAGARAIRQCLALDTAAQRAADGAPPVDYFELADPSLGGPTQEEIEEFLAAWKTARQTRATGFIPPGLKYQGSGFDPEKLQLAEQRQHAVLEIARVAGIDPEELGVSTTTRTYANTWDRRKNFLDFTLGSYRAAIEDRLSMPDVTPRGTTVRFDLDGFLRTDAKSRWEAAEIGIRVGAVTPEEVREGEGRPAIGAPVSEDPEPMPHPAPEQDQEVV